MTNFYVDNAVSGSGNGTSWSSAWKSFSNISWSSIKPGDTVYISGGSSSQTYQETLAVGASGSSGSLITITAGVDPGHNGTVIIDGQNTRANGVVVNSHNYVDVEHLSIRNIADAGISVKNATAGVVIEHNDVYSGDPGGGNARGYDVRNSSGVIVRDNSYSTPTNTNAQTDGIFSLGNNGVVFEHNHLVISNNNTTGHSDGIQSYLDYNITIRDNWIEQANTATINNHGMWLSDTHTGGVIKVYDNVVIAPHLTGDSAVTHWAESTWTETGTAQFWNNTIEGGARSLNLYNTPNAEAKDNILMPAAGGVGVFIADAAIPTSHIDNNLIWAPNGNVASVLGSTKNWAGWQALGYDAHGVNADPKFTNLSGNDLTLTSASPAIDHGATLAEVTTDYAGTARPQGAGYDIGAYEYHGSTTSTSGTSTTSTSGTSTSSTSGSTTSSAPVVQPFTLSTSGSIPSTAITGTSGNDTLTGTSHGDLIDGLAGADTMSGGGGNDYYVVDNSGDKVVENAFNGYDTVLLKAATYTLPDNVENLTLQGSIAHAVSGNALNNLITASDANDTIDGGAGNDILKAGKGADVLTGGTGHDMFVFANLPNAGAVSTVKDFHIGEDLLDLRQMLSGYASAHPNGNPVADGIISLVADASGGTSVLVDPGHTGTMHQLATVEHVSPATIRVGTDLLWH
jgi:Ca2+-binding RTX toxin-like protein